MAKKVAVIMGSDSDLSVMMEAVDKLKQFRIPYEVRIISAHRTPALAEQFASTAADNGFGVIIAGAGKAAHLGGVLAASLTKELLHAGFESASTARLVNIALALKSDDESAVALDALSIDLYTGDAVLYKAGAAASFLLRDGKAAVYSGDTLPIGILGSVTGRRELLCLSPGDTAVLVSDGALAPGASWLRAQLVAHADDAPQKLADAVARAAREKQQDMPDDVTVMALRLRAVE